MFRGEIFLRFCNLILFKIGKNPKRYMTCQRLLCNSPKNFRDFCRVPRKWEFDTAMEKNHGWENRSVID